MLGFVASFTLSSTLKSLGTPHNLPPATSHFARPHLSPSTRREDATAVQKHLWATRDLFSTDVHGIVRCGPQLAPPRFRLAYIPCRNRGEILRLILEESGAEYELEVVGFKNWETGVKATTPHGKLPVLRDYDGRGSDLGQEGAITRHLASECGLAGEGAAERAAVDSLYCFWFATLRNQGVSHDGEHFGIAALKTCDQTVADVPTYEEIFRRDELPRAVRSLAALGYFERTLEAAARASSWRTARCSAIWASSTCCTSSRRTTTAAPASRRASACRCSARLSSGWRRGRRSRRTWRRRRGCQGTPGPPAARRRTSTSPGG